MTFEIVSKCFYATDFKLKKKHKIEETDQPSLKKYIEEVKQSGMQFFSFSSIIHDTTWIVQTTSFLFNSTCYSSRCSVHSEESDNWQHTGAEIISAHQEGVTCLSSR